MGECVCVGVYVGVAWADGLGLSLLALSPPLIFILVSDLGLIGWEYGAGDPWCALGGLVGTALKPRLTQPKSLALMSIIFTFSSPHMRGGLAAADLQAIQLQRGGDSPTVTQGCKGSESGWRIAPGGLIPEIAASKGPLVTWRPREGRSKEDHLAGAHRPQSPRRACKSLGPLHCFLCAESPLPSFLSLVNSRSFQTQLPETVRTHLKWVRKEASLKINILRSVTFLCSCQNKLDVVKRWVKRFCSQQTHKIPKIMLKKQL